MQAPTILLAAVFSLLALVLRPGAGCGVVVASFLLWPEYLRFPLGPVQMSATRVVACVLLARLLTIGRQSKVKWSWPDACIVIHYFWNLIAAVSANSDEAHMSEMLGRVFDTVVIYFTARLAFVSYKDLQSSVAVLGFSAIVLGTLGFLEAVTYRSPYQKLMEYHQWMWMEKDLSYRLGMLRASGSASHPIYFGLAMCMLAGTLWAFRSLSKHRYLHYLVVLFAVLGSLSSLSSGPMMGIVTTILLSIFYFVPSLIYPGLLCLAALSVLFELLSNRHFYNLIDYLALNKGTAWYRTKLTEVAFSNVGEYWAVGVGSNWPHHWGQQIDSRLHVDVVNNFIIVALNGGLLGLFLYCASSFGVLRNAVRCYKSSTLVSVQAASFGLAVTLISLLTVSMSVGLFGPQLIFYYIVMGMTMSLQPVKYTVSSKRSLGRTISSDSRVRYHSTNYTNILPTSLIADRTAYRG